MKFLAAVVIALVATSATSSPAEARSKDARRIAVVVGANAAAPGRKPLRYAHNDAGNVAQVLRLAGFDRDSIHVLRDPRPEALLRQLDRAIAQVGGDEAMLFFYYSGHADARALYPDGQALPLADLRQRLDSSRITVRLGIIDACRGGGWTGTKGLSETEPFEVSVPLSLQNEGSVLISSSSGLEDAHESEHLRGSFFTHHFSAGLRGAADDNEDGTVSLVEAFQYAKRLTVRDTALHTEEPQHPSFRMNLRGRSDLPLVRVAAAGSVLAVEQDAGPMQLLHLESGLVVLELPHGPRSLRLSLPPGRYLVRREANGKTYAREITVGAGKVTQVREEQLALVGTPRLAVKAATRPKKLSRLVLNFGIGIGHGPTGVEEESKIHFALGGSVGYRVLPRWQAVVAVDTLSDANPNNGDEEGLASSLTTGVRVHPLAAPTVHDGRGSAANLTLRFGVGVAERHRLVRYFRSRDYRGGLAATIGMGWFRAPRLGGIELVDVIERFDGITSHRVALSVLF